MENFQTKHWLIEKSDKLLTTYPHVQEAAQWIKDHEVIAFPTETVYGLGANALSDQAVQKIFSAKGRPSDNPLIVHIANEKQLSALADEPNEYAKALIAAFWPGPLTIVLKKKGAVSKFVTAGLETVAVRMPDHPIALALIEAADAPLAAPSANRSGKPSPTTADHVLKDLNGRIAGVLDGGPTGVGLESTVVDCTGEKPIILRPGGVTKEELETVVGKVEVDQALLTKGQAPKSPGMKYTHYAPNAPLILVDKPYPQIQELVDKAREDGKKVGVLTTEENKSYYHADIVHACGLRKDLKTVAHQLYDSLRSFDQYPLDVIYSECFPTEGVGDAVMNRLLKAAGEKVIR